jgi:endonuclease/exonuclease/phosphatase family metal-dependent hydrolase
VLPGVARRFSRPRRTALIAATGLLLHGLAVASLFQQPERPRFAHTVELKVAWFNLHNTHQSVASLRQILKDDPPDVVAFGEAQFADIKMLPGYEQVVRSKWGGVVLYSRLPIDNARVYDVKFGRGVLEVDVLVGGERVRIFAAHPYKPGTGEHTREFRHLTALVKRAATETDRVVLLGDLNQTRWSALFKELLDGGQLHPACAGHGLCFTWAPFTGFPLGLGIDHVLVGEGVQVEEFEVLPWLEGSDHRALRARLGIRTELGEGAAQD